MNPIFEATIESLDLEARGIAHRDGKVIFVEGALTGERVYARASKIKPNYEIAELESIRNAAASRIPPRCQHFGVCGGCSMQHLDPASQVAIKQRVLEDNLWHLAQLRAGRMLRPIHGPSWHYRFRARLSVRYVRKKGGILIGFHERKRSFVADLKACHILPAHVSALLLPLRALVSQLSIKERLPQIELAVGEELTVLVFRILRALSPTDAQHVRSFAEQHKVQIWLQTEGPDSAIPFWPLDAGVLQYTLPEYGIRMPFRPTDFTQVNHAINRVLVHRAIQLLEPRRTDRVADLFCGIGNFTLPLATRCAQVVGIEGSATLSERASHNAQSNGLRARASFVTCNLFEVSANDFLQWGRFDRMLIDPPRDGAAAVVLALSQLRERPRRIVYVSCNPATLARDAAVLVGQAGYRLSAAGVVNMFTHTSHVESIAVFDQQ